MIMIGEGFESTVYFDVVSSTMGVVFSNLLWSVVGISIKWVYTLLWVKKRSVKISFLRLDVDASVVDYLIPSMV